MTHTNGSPESLEKHQQEVRLASPFPIFLFSYLKQQVCGAFARAAVAMRDAAQTAESFSNWFSRVNNLQNVPVPPMFNGSHNVASQIPGLPQNSEAEKTGKKRKTSGDPEGKKKRPAREKKPIDPNAPKRPPSAYLLFQNDVRKAVKDQHPDMPYNQVLTEVSKLWHALTSEERAVRELLISCHVSSLSITFLNLQPYMQATADSKDIYKKAKADYDALSPTEAKDVKEASAKPSPSKSKAPAVVRCHSLSQPTHCVSHPYVVSHGRKTFRQGRRDER